MSIGTIRTAPAVQVATAGTAVRLADTTGAATGAQTIVIQALNTNTGNVCVGGSNVKAAPGTQTAPTQIGLCLKPNDWIALDAANLSEIYVDAVTSNDGVTWMVGAS